MGTPEQEQAGHAVNVTRLYAATGTRDHQETGDTWQLGNDTWQLGNDTWQLGNDTCLWRGNVSDTCSLEPDPGEGDYLYKVRHVARAQKRGKWETLMRNACSPVLCNVGHNNQRTNVLKYPRDPFYNSFLVSFFSAAAAPASVRSPGRETIQQRDEECKLFKIKITIIFCCY